MFWDKLMMNVGGVKAKVTKVAFGGNINIIYIYIFV